jgi:hypothetical protein
MLPLGRKITVNDLGADALDEIALSLCAVGKAVFALQRFLQPTRTRRADSALGTAHRKRGRLGQSFGRSLRKFGFAAR